MKGSFRLGREEVRTGDALVSVGLTGRSHTGVVPGVDEGVDGDTPVPLYRPDLPSLIPSPGLTSVTPSLGPFHSQTL